MTEEAQIGAHSNAGPADRARGFPLWLLLVMLVSMALAAFSAWHRVPWDDEGEFSNAAWNLAKHGFMGTTVLDSPEQEMPHIGQRTYCTMPLYLLGQAAWYLVFPGTVFWARAFSIIWIPLALYALFQFLWRFTGNRGASALAVMFFGLSYGLIDNAGFARTDVMYCTLGIAGLAAYVMLRERSLAWALAVSNTFIALSMLTHPNALFHFLGLVLIVFWLDARRLNWKLVALSAVPYFAALGAWLVYILQDPHAFVAQMWTYGKAGRVTKSWNPILIIKNEIVERYVPAFGLATRGAALMKAYVLLAYVAAIIGVIATPGLRKQRPVRGLLYLLAVYFVAMSIFSQKLSYYLVNILPWYAALLGIWLEWVWRTQRSLRLLVAAAAGLAVAVDCSGIVLRAMQRSYIVAQHDAVEFLLTHTQPTDRISGTAGLVYALHFDGRLREDKYLGLRGGVIPNAVVVDPDMWAVRYKAWETEHPEDLQRVQERLRNYRLAYDRGGYKIYLRQQ